MYYVIIASVQRLNDYYSLAINFNNRAQPLLYRTNPIHLSSSAAVALRAPLKLRPHNVFIFVENSRKLTGNQLQISTNNHSKNKDKIGAALTKLIR